MGSLFQELNRRKVFRAGIVYVAVAWLLIQVIDTVLPNFGTPLWVIQTLTLILMLGFPLTVLLAWAYEITPDGIKSDEDGAPLTQILKATQKQFYFGIAAIAAFITLGYLVTQWIISDQASIDAPPDIARSNEASSPESDTTRRDISTVINLGILSRKNNRPRTDIDISGDGSLMIYTALKQGMNQLYIRELNELEPRLIAESRLSDFINPRLSPENTWIAYYLEQENTIQIVPTQGGPSQQVITNTSGSWGWLDETTLLFSDAGFELTRIDIGTGETTPVELQIQDNEYPLWVHALPDQKGLLFTVSLFQTLEHGGRIELLDFEAGQQRMLIENGFNARYVRSGHLIFLRRGALWAVPFDPESLTITGTAVPVVENIESSGFDRSGAYAVTDDGLLLYLPGTDLARNSDRTLVWMTENGTEIPLNVAPQAYADISISPDGSQLALTIIEQSGLTDIWTFDFSLSNLSRRTFSGDAMSPVWSADGKQIIFSSLVSSSLHIVAADGSGDVEALTETGRLQVPYAVTPDGTQLIISDRESGSFDIRTLSLTERSDPVPLIASEYGETGAALSPNGQLIAYVSDEAGPDQVFIRPMDNLRQKFQISADGGRHPVWSPSGDTLYYFRSSDSAIMMAKIDTERGFTATRPQPLFSAQFLDGEIVDFDVSSDNQRLLILKKTISTGEASVPGLASLVVVDNWFARLREVAPIN